MASITKPEIIAVDVESNIERIFAHATREDILGGMNWYADAAKTLAAHAAANGLNPGTAFGVAAIISAGKAWDGENGNLQTAIRMLEDFAANGTIISDDNYGLRSYESVRKCENLMQQDLDNPLDAVYLNGNDNMGNVVGGRKVRSFASNFAGEYGLSWGNSYLATMDAHMGRVVFGDPTRKYQDSGFGNAAYTIGENAVVNVAANNNIKPCQLQAIVWVVVRRLVVEARG